LMPGREKDSTLHSSKKRIRSPMQAKVNIPEGHFDRYWVFLVRNSKQPGAN
jgi:hypothetical protein